MPCASQGPQIVLQLIYLEALGGWGEIDSIAKFSIGLSFACLVVTFLDAFGTTIWVYCYRDADRSGNYAI